MFDQIHKTADFEESIFVQRQKMYSFKQEISRQLPMACNRPYPSSRHLVVKRVKLFKHGYIVKCF